LFPEATLLASSSGLRIVFSIAHLFKEIVPVTTKQANNKIQKQTLAALYSLQTGDRPRQLLMASSNCLYSHERAEIMTPFPSRRLSAIRFLA
jgi:hypothetical protein